MDDDQFFLNRNLAGLINRGVSQGQGGGKKRPVLTLSWPCETTLI